MAINRTVIVSMTVYMDMINERKLYEDETVDMALENTIFQSGNSGNSIESLLYLNKNANNQGNIAW